MALKFNYDFEFDDNIITIYDQKYEITEAAIIKLNVEFQIWKLNDGFELEIDNVTIKEIQYDGWEDYVNGEETTIEINNIDDFEKKYIKNNSSGEDNFNTVISNIEVNIDKKIIEITFTQE
jgi:hypothetical protein